jgi:hypothetical protein
MPNAETIKAIINNMISGIKLIPLKYGIKAEVGSKTIKAA